MFSKRAVTGLVSLLLLLAAPAWADSPMEAKLLEVKGDSIKLNKGGRNGVSVGQIFDLYQEARVYYLPLTSGEVPLVKSQRRVARIQVFQVEPSTSRGRVLSREQGSDGGKIPLKAKGLRAIHNPTAIAPNRKPVFLATPTYKAKAWGEKQQIWLKVSNESDDAEVYTWRVSGGRISAERTIRPYNTWTAPATAGKYQLTVSVQDSAGNVNQTAITLVSSGVPRNRTLPTRWPATRLYGTFSRYGKVRDLAFDNLGRKFFLDSKGGWGGYTKVRVEKASGQLVGRPLPVEDVEFTSVAVQGKYGGVPGALFALEADSKTILRYDFAGVSWKNLFSRKPLVIGHPDGGTGNARFDEPVDLAVSKDNEIYVLDAGQRCVQVFEVTGKGEEAKGVFLVSFGRPGSGPMELKKPVAMAVGRDNSVYVLDNGRKTVVIYRAWRPVHEFSVGGEEEELVGIAVDPFSNDVYVLDRTKGAVIHYSRSGKLLNRFGENKTRGHPGRLKEPVRLRMDPRRMLWVVDRNGTSTVRFDEKGKFLGRTGGIEFGGHLRVSGAPDGGFAVLDKEEFQVTRFDRSGWITARFGAEGTKQNQFQEPIDLTISKTGEIFVLDAEKKSLLRFSPNGAYLGKVGKGGSERSELMEVKDLVAVNDRSYVSVVQQRPKWNFNLFHPGKGKSERTFGEYVGELAPRYGCVTGVTGSLSGTGKASAKPWYWTVDDDREKVYLARRGVDPTAVKHSFDSINDIEPGPDNLVFVADPGDDQIVVLSEKGAVVAKLTSKYFETPWDIGVDGYGHVYVYDKSTKRIVRLVPRK